MSKDPDIRKEHEDGEVWARIYIATLASPARDRRVSAADLAQYARTVADRYVDFRRACRRASEDVHHSRGSGASRSRITGPTHLGAWRGADCSAGRDEPR